MKYTKITDNVVVKRVEKVVMTEIRISFEEAELAVENKKKEITAKQAELVELETQLQELRDLGLKPLEQRQLMVE